MTTIPVRGNSGAMPAMAVPVKTMLRDGVPVVMDGCHPCVIHEEK
ncbi:MAG: hypothetical protein Q4C47_02010 [Planctomycetia bacterium]|nr:hypothetical protein [Planctomycetia bacterium]